MTGHNLFLLSPLFLLISLHLLISPISFSLFREQLRRPLLNILFRNDSYSKFQVRRGFVDRLHICTWAASRAAKWATGNPGKSFHAQSTQKLVGMVNGVRRMSVFVYANRESITVYSTQAFAHWVQPKQIPSWHVWWEGVASTKREAQAGAGPILSITRITAGFCHQGLVRETTFTTRFTTHSKK